MPSPFKRLRYQIEWFAVAAMAKLIPLLPRQVLLALAKGLGRAAYVFDRRGRETGLANVRAAMAAGALPEGDAEAIVRRSFEFFARSTCELFWSSRLDRENYSEHIQVDLEDPAAFEKAAREGAIWVTPHYGNFEWISLMMGFRGHPFTLIAQDFKNPKLTEIFTRHREGSGHRVIPSRRAFVRLLKALGAGGHAAFLTDLTVAPDSTAVPVRCFSFTTCVTGLHAFLQNRTGATLIPGYCVPCGDGDYLMKLLKPLEVPAGAAPAEVAQLCWDVFEPAIREFPEPWLWMYKHWRYRPGGEGGARYPAYANRSKKFDRWLEGAEGGKA